MNKSILTKREKQIFEMLIQNKTTKDISNELDISEKTVRNHIHLPNLLLIIHIKHSKIEPNTMDSKTSYLTLSKSNLHVSMKSKFILT